ncbi:MAG TPA: glutamyl-tRNA reductase [Chitinophagaceae bacterium]|jgi:glutamyl-tRNA reductase
MQPYKQTDLSKFFVAGINYRKTDAAVRGLFAIGSEQYETLLQQAPSFNIDALFVVSTCNRTEIYGFAEDASLLINLLCTQTPGDEALFTRLAYTKSGIDAMEHLFRVGAGLDSQLLGDYEIVGQIKQAVKFSKERHFINPFLERLVNCVLQASKTIKNTTALSGGTVSLSFAAVQYIKEKITDAANKKILLVGTGKIGRNTCKNLVDYLHTTNITLINRSEEKAAALAAELGLRHAPLHELPSFIESSDIILVATNAPLPTVLKAQLENGGSKLIIDLSIPYNVETAARELPGITLVNVDELSKLKDETLQKREAEVPKAKSIIAQHIAEFMEWNEMRRHAPLLRAVKTKLNELHSCPIFSLTGSKTVSPVLNAEASIQRVINGMATKMRARNQQGCHYIEAINEFIRAVAN